MEGWTDGYVTGIEYTNAFYGELAPELLSFSMTLRGVCPPPRSGFSYCELGCGHGYSTNLLAAAYPQARFVGVDFNSAHIANARALAEAAGLANAVFHDSSFADFARGDDGFYDFIVMHGVWSWVSDDSRETLIDLIRRRLKPGGALYVSYNCLPGWAAHAPLRQLLAMHVDDAGAGVGSGEASLDGRLQASLGFAGRVAAVDAGYFAKVREAAHRLGALSKLPLGYVAHEYLNHNWTPFYHYEVARALAGAGLSFVAPAVPLDHLEAYAIPAEGRALLQEARDPSYRETLRDYLTNTSFRRDVFAKDAGVLGEEERLNRLRRTRFVLTAVRDDVPRTVNVPVGSVLLPPDLYDPLADALTAGPLSLDELLARTEVGRHGLGPVLAALMVLCGLGKAAPVLDDPDGGEARRASAAGFNEALLRRDPLGEELRFLASPVLGTGVSIGRGEGLFLLARRLGRDPVAFAWEHLETRGRRLSRDGKPLETAEENIEELRLRYGGFEQRRLPLLRRLGIDEVPAVSAASELVAAAGAHLAGNRHSDAAALCRRALVDQPAVSQALNILALAELPSRGPERAKEVLSRAIAIGDSKGHFHANRARLRKANGDVEGAIADYLYALELAPDKEPLAQALLDLHLAKAEQLMAGPRYYDQLARVHDLLKPRGYLEVGVCDGKSLAYARPPTVAVGVDPFPGEERFPAFAAPTTVFPLTSDAFFSRYASPAAAGLPALDLAFLDGLHTFEQTLRDFINTERWANPGSVVLIHDCLPLDSVTAARERRTLFWSGDVWKIIPILRRFRPDLDVFTLATAPTGLGVVSRLDPASTVLADRYDAIVAEYMAIDFAWLEEDRAGRLAVAPNDLTVLAERLAARFRGRRN